MMPGSDPTYSGRVQRRDKRKGENSSVGHSMKKENLSWFKNFPRRKWGEKNLLRTRIRARAKEGLNNKNCKKKKQRMGLSGLYP